MIAESCRCAGSPVEQCGYIAGRKKRRYYRKSNNNTLHAWRIPVAAFPGEWINADAIECSGFLNRGCHRIRAGLLRFPLQWMELERRCVTGIRLSKHALPVTDPGDRRLC